MSAASRDRADAPDGDGRGPSGDYDFDLPEGLIALRPAEPRGSARMLVVAPGASPELVDGLVADLPQWLRPGDCLVLNDTRVIPAQLSGRRIGGEGGDPGGRVGFTLMKRLADGAWTAFAKPAKKLRPGSAVLFGAGEEALRASIRERTGAEVILAGEAAAGGVDEIIRRFGAPPLPPYIAARRPVDARDAIDYQTVFAARDGAVAAPTAALHLTPDMLDRIRGMGVSIVFVTLHVGAGTFLPVKADDPRDHGMHAEWGEIRPAAADAINAARAQGGRVVACGTTALRLLESAARDDGGVAPFQGETDIFILPGYRFRVADALMTNFHLPRSTLFMLVCAFAGTGRMRRAYAHAVAEGYRFYSYGDSSFLHRAEAA